MQPEVDPEKPVQPGRPPGKAQSGGTAEPAQPSGTAEPAQPSGTAAAAGLGRHLPTRPDWRCSACGADWPCQVARSRLTTAYRTAPLPVIGYLRDQARIAAVDLGRAPLPGYVAAGFRVRFLSWLRPDNLP